MEEWFANLVKSVVTKYKRTSNIRLNITLVAVRELAQAIEVSRATIGLDSQSPALYSINESGRSGYLS